MPEHIAPKVINWASILEDNTREQALKTASMPFIFPHLALMPDAHLGKGATVGSVIPTVGAIIPAAVGVDIGCGMMAVRTQWTRTDIEVVTANRPKPGEVLGSFSSGLADLHAAIVARVPLSAGKYNTEMTETAARRTNDLAQLPGWDQAQLAAPNWRLQLGTLGSGNHFIEVSLDEQERVWLFLHTGSRGVGNKLATKHIKVAQEQCKRRFISLPDPDLAYLVEGEPEFWQYLEALRWAQKFAVLNREEIMDRVVEAMSEFMDAPVERHETIECHHNYTTQEYHFGKRVWLSRKGAINAHEGVPGLIPGSMGDRSYVVEGKGDRLSLHSSPHGAGRQHSRNVAKRMFTRSAYKPIDQVMNDAAELVSVRHTLRQIVNVKGS